jgi:hypothetical protein
MLEVKRSKSPNQWILQRKIVVETYISENIDIVIS